MITINQINCTTAFRGTGTKGCKIDFGQISKYFFTKKGTKLNIATDNLDQAKIDELVAANTMVIMPEHTFTPQPEATVYQTQPNGSKVKVRDGLFEALATYTNKGICFANAISGLAQIDWDVWLLDDKGVLYFEETEDGFIKGFSTNLVDRDNRIFNDGSNASGVSLIVQFSVSGTRALSSSVGYIANSNVDFDSLEGVNDVELLVEGTPSPGDVKFKAVISCDGTTNVSGLEADFIATATDGTIEDLTATESNGVYTATNALASGDYIITTVGVVKDSENAYYNSPKGLPITIV